MNRKAFTLTELLVVIIIIGIISGISIPLIRNITSGNENKKYSTYLDSLEKSAKIYVSSYQEDLFYDSSMECNYITYEDLFKKNLIKDISVDGITCDSEYTFVKVNKKNNKYTYEAYIGCGSSKDNIKIFIPKKVDKTNVCS